MCVLIAGRIVVWWAFRARAPGKRLLQLSLWQSHLQVGLAPGGSSSRSSSRSSAASFYADPRRGSGSPDPGQGWSEAGVGGGPLSETFSLAFGFSGRKRLVRAAERRASAQLQTCSRSQRQLLRFICLGSGMFNHAISNLPNYSVSRRFVITLNQGRVCDFTNKQTPTHTAPNQTHHVKDLKFLKTQYVLVPSVQPHCLPDNLFSFVD